MEYAFYGIRTTMQRYTYIAPIALAACLWTAAGESSAPILTASELPAEVRDDCAVAAVSANTGAVCSAEDNYTSRWVGHSAAGDLFVVVRTPCEGAGCRAWLVQRSGQVSRSLLAVTGEFRLQRTANAYPSVQERTELSDDYVRYSRFVWNGNDYVRADTRLVHTIGGLECGTAEECHDAARAALKKNDTDRAVRIWQHVHGVAWI